MLKNLTKFVAPIALISSSVFAQSGFFVGASVNAQQDAYNLKKNAINNDIAENQEKLNNIANAISGLRQKFQESGAKMTETRESVYNNRLQLYNLAGAWLNQKDDNGKTKWPDGEEMPTNNSQKPTNNSQKPTEAQNNMLISLKQAISVMQLANPQVPNMYDESQKKVFEMIVASFQEINVNTGNQVMEGQFTTGQNKQKYLNSISKEEEAEKAHSINSQELQKLKDEEKGLKKEIASNAQLQAIKSSSSKIVPSVSLMGGYAFNYQNFGFITELGVDITNSKINSTSLGNLYGDSSFEVRNNFNLYLAQKVGYKFTENTLTYATFGLGVKDTRISFNGYKKVNEKKNTMNMILGVGYEYKFNQLGIFTELNHIASLSAVKTAVGDVKTSSQQVKIGARYYF